MANYILPQVKIFQQYAQLPLAVTSNQHAFVYGPSYKLYRYANAGIKEHLLFSKFRGLEGDRIPLPMGGEFDLLDVDYVKVFADNARLGYAGVSSAISIVKSGDSITTPDGGFTIYVDSVDLSAASDTDNIGAMGGVKVGDRVHFDYVLDDFANVVKVGYHDGTMSAVTLDRTAPSDATNVSFSRLQSGLQIKSDLFDVTAEGVKMTTTYVDQWNKTYTIDLGSTAILEGDLYVEYRVRNLDNIFGVQQVNNVNEVLVNIGADIHPDDPLTYGVYMAVLNGGNKDVYYIATDGTQNEWTNVFNAVRDVGPYAFAPLTNDRGILENVKSHIADYSSAEAKRWRIAFVTSPYPDYQMLFDSPTLKATTVAAGTSFSVTVSDANAQDINLYALRAGDVMFYTISGEQYKATVKSITSANEVVVDDEDGKLTAMIGLSIAFGRSTDSATGPTAVSNIVKDVSMRFHSQRLYHVFAGKSITTYSNTGDVYEVAPYMIAAAVAGLCTSVPPQQGLTSIELKGIANVQDMYRRFSQGNLDTMAEGGTLLVTQDTPNGAIYVRHQLSTARRDNNLNTTELSLVKNLDSISYYFSTQFKNMIGVTNITDETLALVRLRLQDGVDYLSTYTSIQDANQNSYSIGPQLIAEGTKINFVERDPVFQDTVNADVDLNLPKPFNIFNLVLRAI